MNTTRPLYYEEFVALFGFLSRDPWPRLSLEMAEATRLGLTWDRYCQVRHDEALVERFRDRGAA